MRNKHRRSAGYTHEKVMPQTIADKAHATQRYFSRPLPYIKRSSEKSRFPSFRRPRRREKRILFPIATKEPNHENPARPDRRAALVFLRRRP